MSSRRRSREHALQILYQWDMRKQPVDESIDAFYGTLYSEESPAAVSYTHLTLPTILRV